jgi:exosortase
MNTAQISIGYWFSSLLLLTLTVLALFRFNWYVVFPAFYLIFIFPFWGSLIGLLQDMSVTSVEYMMSFTGIPTYVEAQYVSIPAGTFEIANGCSGLRYFIVSLSISSLYIFLFINNIKRAGIFFLFAILGGLITNWLRITILVIIGHQTDMTHSLMNDHNSFGWYVYLPFMLLLFMLGNKLKDHDLLDSAPLQNSSLVKTVGAPNYPTLIILVLVLFSSSTLLHNVINNQVADDKKPYHLSSLSPKIFNYSHIETVQLPNFSLDSVYNIYSYDSKDLDSKPTYFENTYLAKGWDIESDISTNEWNIYIVRKNTKRAIMAYSFQLNNFRTSSSKSFKIERLKTAFSNPGNPTLHWLYTPCLSRCVSESKKVSYYLESASLTK